MECKTRVNAEEGKQELFIDREFDLPLELLFKAYADKEILEQWMGTKVIALDNKKHGSWQFETSNTQGVVVFSANGTIHSFIPNQQIIRTFEMENAPFGVQLETLGFEPLTEVSSRLHIHIVYQSVDKRDQMLKMGMGKGMSMAHDRLQDIVNKLK